MWPRSWSVSASDHRMSASSSTTRTWVTAGFFASVGEKVTVRLILTFEHSRFRPIARDVGCLTLNALQKAIRRPAQTRLGPPDGKSDLCRRATCRRRLDGERAAVCFHEAPG